MKFRCATPADSSLIYNWRVDPVSAENSVQKEFFSFEDHQQWYQAKLADPLCAIFLFHFCDSDENQPLGVVRMDGGTEHTRMSIIVSPQFRRQGLAARMIRQITLHWRAEHPEPILAIVKKDNVASRKAFERSGFQQDTAGRFNEVDFVTYIY